MAGAMGDRAVVVPLENVDAAVEVIAALHDRLALDAVLAVDDQGLVVAAAASARLGLPITPSTPWPPPVTRLPCGPVWPPVP